MAGEIKHLIEDRTRLEWRSESIFCRSTDSGHNQHSKLPPFHFLFMDCHISRQSAFLYPDSWSSLLVPDFFLLPLDIVTDESRDRTNKKKEVSTQRHEARSHNCLP